MIVGAHSFPVTGDGEHNFSTICAAAERAAEAGAELLLFPECALTGYPPRDIPSSAAVDFPRLAEMHAALHKLSDARNLALIVGSMVPAENGVRNAVMIFRPGEEPLIYAKRALWGWDRDKLRTPARRPCCATLRGAFSSKTRRMRRIFCSSISPNTSRISGNAGGSNSPTALCDSFPHIETSSETIWLWHRTMFLTFRVPSIL